MPGNETGGKRHPVTVGAMTTLNGLTWQARCKCGWSGDVFREQLNETAVLAIRDGDRHCSERISS